MEWRSELAVRDRAFRLVRAVTISAVCGVVAMAGIFSTAAAMTFSGKPVVRHDPPPVVPTDPAPAQKPPPAPIIVKQVVHVPYGYSYTGASSAGVRPPAASGTGAAPPPPPPPPACVSTPSKPC